MATEWTAFHSTISKTYDGAFRTALRGAICCAYGSTFVYAVRKSDRNTYVTAHQ
jgi:hypothetical protein